MQYKNVRVSICMATYNGEKYVRRQLESILNQLSENDEIIVIDDYSNDLTRDIIKSFKDKRILLWENSVNLGVAASFEIALRKSKGDIIFFSDQDDIWFNNKIEKILREFEKSKADIIQHDSIVVNGDLVTIYESFFKFRKAGNGIVKNFIASTYLGCCMAIRSNIKEKFLPIPSCAGYHDRWIGIIGELHGYKVSFMYEQLMYYIRHGNNDSTMKTRAIHLIIKDRIFFIYAIIAFYMKKYLNFK